jgi:hypothetical protein
MIAKVFDFINNLLENNIMACPLVGSSEGYFIADHTSGMSHYTGHKDYDLIKNVISKLNLTESADKLSFCLSNSFVLNNSRLIDLLELTKGIKIECKMHSESSERFLAGILYVLNNNINTSVEKKRLEEVFNLLMSYVNVKFDYFTKYVHNKGELTLDK